MTTNDYLQRTFEAFFLQQLTHHLLRDADGLQPQPAVHDQSTNQWTFWVVLITITALMASAEWIHCPPPSAGLRRVKHVMRTLNNRLTTSWTNIGASATRAIREVNIILTADEPLAIHGHP